MKVRRPNRGFTLVELLVGATLSAAVMLAVLSTYVFLGRNFSRLLNQQTLESQARQTLAYFAKDVQSAIGISGTPSASSLVLTVPTDTGTTTTITYTYTSDAGGNGTFVRTPAIGNSLTLLRYITSSPGLRIRYFDAAGTEYTAFTDYLSGIKQVSVEFTSRIVTTNQGSTTSSYPWSSSRVILRNKQSLP
jgi:prepilin-type N-terminal cleavage/methylation domain-containing protein